jgi:DNA-binding SARP family transcriptional activator
MAIMFAATYPHRVDGLILEGTGATLMSDADRERLADPAERAESRARAEVFVDAWGTPDSMTLARFAPSLLADDEFVRWWPRYERQSASRDALLALFELNGQMDARGVIDRVECPILIVHRTGDQIIPVEIARETAALFEAAGKDVTLVEVPGTDHYTFAGDMEPIMAAIERFATGTVQERPAAASTPVSITTLGEFRVEVDGVEVPTGEWGSRRARTLLKRLVAAQGWPVTRDELIELLWPDDAGADRDRLSARLSVQLSAVRRVLRGGVIADRSTVRLDLNAVDLDLARWNALTDERSIVDGYGEFLPDDLYDDWSGPTRDEVRGRMVTAARRLVDLSLVAGDAETAETAARAIVRADQFDEVGHQGLIRALAAQGRHGEARSAHEAYTVAMHELGVEATPLDDIV